MWRLVLVAIALGGCPGAGPQFLGAQPSWRTGDPPPVAPPPAEATAITFAPGSDAAAWYNAAPAPVPVNPLSSAVIAAVQGAATEARLAAPTADARLFRACAELAEIVPATGIVDYAFVEFALQRNGIIEPAPHLYVWWGAIDPSSIADQLRPDLVGLFGDGAPARFGVGAARRKPDGTGAIVFVLQDTPVSTAPIPRAVAAGGSFMLDAVLDARYREPEVFVTHDDGRPEQLATQPGRPGGFRLAFSCGVHRGREQLEISADSAIGPSVLANFPVWCGTAPPGSITEPNHDDAPATTTPEAAERYVLEAVNRDRGAAGLAPLVWDDQVAAVARLHSEEMLHSHLVAHRSATGSVLDRVRAARIKTGVVLENVARAYSVREIHEGLMNSPGHRFNLMSREVNHLGIGVVFGEQVSGTREMFITQVFTWVAPVLDRAAVLQTVRRKFTAARPAMTYKPELGPVAQQCADALAAGASPEAARQQVQPVLDGFYAAYAHLSLLIVPTNDVEQIDLATRLGAATADGYGLAIAQGPHPDLGDHAIWIVLLFAHDRRP